MRAILGCRLAICASALLLSACGSSQSALAPISVSTDRVNRATTSSEKVIYTFTGALDGGDPATALTFDGAGNIYGTTVLGGSSACGTIFKLVPKNGSTWRESVLESFDCYSGGKNPYGGVVLDQHGNLYGTTVSGGSGGSCGSTGCGVVFRLSSRAEMVLHSFTGNDDGFGPGGAVVFRLYGDLFGTTPDGGKDGEGVVYQLEHRRNKGNHWRETIVHAFTGGKDGGTGSLGALLVGSGGTLYGVAETGGAYGAGTVYQLILSSGKWRFTTLYAFKGTPDAASPYGGLIDGPYPGYRYGTTYYGGKNGLGAVYVLVPKSSGGYEERVLYSFKGGNDGSAPTSTLLSFSGTTLYGTTSAGGGSCGCGTVFAVDAKSGKEKVLHAFSGGSDGAYPYYGVTADSSGNLYGTTVAGGTENQGTVYEVTP
jgi:uncharacterized repeat protein (TIGR03803 family)